MPVLPNVCEMMLLVKFFSMTFPEKNRKSLRDLRQIPGEKDVVQISTCMAICKFES